MEAYKCELNKDKKLCEHRRDREYRNPFSCKIEAAPYCNLAEKYIDDLCMGCPDLMQLSTEPNKS